MVERKQVSSKTFRQSTINMLIKIVDKPYYKIVKRPHKKRYIHSQDLYGDSVQYSIKAPDNTIVFTIEKLTFNGYEEYNLTIGGKKCTENITQKDMEYLFLYVAQTHTIGKKKIVPRWKNKQNSEEQVLSFLSEHVK